MARGKDLRGADGPRVRELPPKDEHNTLSQMQVPHREDFGLQPYDLHSMPIRVLLDLRQKVLQTSLQKVQYLRLSWNDLPDDPTRQNTEEEIDLSENFGCFQTYWAFVLHFDDAADRNHGSLLHPQLSFQPGQQQEEESFQLWERL